MASLLATAGSNSSTSINYLLVRHTASLVEAQPVELLELATLTIPMYSKDRERETGFPGPILSLLEKIRACSGLILSVNEHNGNPSAFTKNILDWLSRKDRNFLEDKRVFLMSASPGKRGGQSSRAAIAGMLPRFGGEVAAEFSLPSFNDNFDADQGIVSEELRRAHQEALENFLSRIG